MSRKKSENQPTGETKEQKFIRIMPKRVNVALDKLRLVKNVFGSKQYAMSEEQYNKVISVLLKSVGEIESAYKSRNKKATELETFEL